MIRFKSKKNTILKLVNFFLKDIILDNNFYLKIYDLFNF